MTAEGYVPDVRFDGDGMLHGCRLKGGKASYCNHAVRTARHKQELEAGTPLYFKVVRFGVYCLFIY